MNYQPLELFRDKRLSWKHIAVYTYVASRAGQKRVMWYTVSRMAEEMDTNRANLGQIITELVDAGWLTRGEHEGKKALFVPAPPTIQAPEEALEETPEIEESVYSVNGDERSPKEESVYSVNGGVYSVNGDERSPEPQSVYILNTECLLSKHRIIKEYKREESEEDSAHTLPPKSQEIPAHVAPPVVLKPSQQQRIGIETLRTLASQMDLDASVLEVLEEFEPYFAVRGAIHIQLAKLKARDAPSLREYFAARSGEYQHRPMTTMLGWYLADRAKGAVKTKPDTPLPDSPLTRGSYKNPFLNSNSEST